MRILRAEHLGMCFGVRDAIKMAEAAASEGPVTILGELVHNRTVLEDLRQRGVRFERSIGEVATERVMITAHGTSDRNRRHVATGGFQVSEATCPLVNFAHESVLRLVREGFHPVIVGKREHVEVRGLTGDLDTFDVVLTPEDIEQLGERPRFGIAAQTTQPIDHVERIVALIRKRFPNSEIRFVDTVCRPTKQRQSAALSLAAQSDVVIVIGGANSNNTRQLVGACRRHCERVHHVQSAGDLRPEWIRDAQVVGLTAGTSTPPKTIDEVERWLWDHAGDPARDEETKAADKPSVTTAALAAKS